jgi:hypothetical protein
MLFELLPHFARLVPMADRFLASRNASESAQEIALAEMAGSVRGDVRHVAEMHAGIQRALKEQGVQVAEIAVEVTRVRMGVESIEARVAGLEKTAGMAMKLLAAGLVLLVGAVALLGLVLLHLSHR